MVSPELPVRAHLIAARTLWGFNSGGIAVLECLSNRTELESMSAPPIEKAKRLKSATTTI